jgi:fatty-acyl-CoA synthase
MRFVKNANVWMETIHAHRGTISFAPNFAFALAVRKASTTGWQGWDLSSVKALGCGAEPIHPETLRDFVRLCEQYRLRADCILPAYGLAESTLAVTMKPLHDPVRFRNVERTTFEETGIAIGASDGTAQILEHVSCGIPFPGHEVAIMDRNGKCVPDCVEGEICVRGPSTAAGYIGNPELWQTMLRNGWLRTGDLGYIADNELYVTGRIKDLIILNGQNIHPQTIEWLAAKVAGVRKGCVAAFSRPGQRGEELVIVVEARTGDNSKMISEIADAVQRAILISPADIVCQKQGSLLRTSSGKLKRHQIRQRYLTDTARENLRLS